MQQLDHCCNGTTTKVYWKWHQMCTHAMYTQLIICIKILYTWLAEVRERLTGNGATVNGAFCALYQGYIHLASAIWSQLWPSNILLCKVQHDSFHEKCGVYHRNQWKGNFLMYCWVRKKLMFCLVLLVFQHHVFIGLAYCVSILEVPFWVAIGLFKHLWFERSTPP